MNFDDGFPFMMVLWLWLLLAPVVGVLVDAGRMKREMRHRRPAMRDDRHDPARDRGLHPMAQPAGGVAR